MTAERSIPRTCPNCRGLVAAKYAHHCGDDKWCGWIVHVDVDCGVIIDTRSARWMAGKS